MDLAKNHCKDAIKLNNLVEMLLQHYQHIIGDQDIDNVSFEKLIENIASYYEDIINCMPGNIYWLSKNGFTMGCNKNVLDMFGFQSLSEFKGLSFEEMGKLGRWTLEAMQAFKNDTLEVITTGKPKLNIEDLPIPHSDGRVIRFLTSRVPLFDHENRVIGVVGVSVDITELKNTQAALKIAKEEAELANLAKSEFVSNMSHDVKTPLTGIIGTAELLTYRLQGEDLEFAQNLLMSGQQLLSFFDNCLEFFKLESNHMAFVAERFSLKELLFDLERLFQPTIRQKELALHIHCHPSLPHYLIGNRTAVYRVLLNLIGNAVKFTHHGSVTIHVCQDKKSTTEETVICLTVEDTGIGIPKDKHQIIFDRFIRLIPSYKGIYDGNGIGLYIVRKFINAMHGEIHVESQEGVGSKFTVFLPFQVSSVNYDDAKTKIKPLFQSHFINEMSSSNEVVAFKQTPAKVLLVEDNLTAQLIQSVLLSSMCSHVEIVDTGEKALDLFEPGKYDLIFMDIGLPGMQGDTVSRLIRKMEQGSSYHVPIIALTAHTGKEEDKYYLAAGMQDRFSKPLTREQAKKIIDHYYSPA